MSQWYAFQVETAAGRLLHCECSAGLARSVRLRPDCLYRLVNRALGNRSLSARAGRAVVRVVRIEEAGG